MRLLGVFRPSGSPAEAYYPDGTPAVYPEPDMPRIERTADVVWEGNLARGEGRISAGSSGAFSGLAYSNATRIGSPDGKTSPEELLAAAHGGCFTMSLAGELSALGHPPERLESTCRITMDEVEGQGHQIVGSHGHRRRHGRRDRRGDVRAGRGARRRGLPVLGAPQARRGDGRDRRAASSERSLTVSRGRGYAHSRRWLIGWRSSQRWRCWPFQQQVLRPTRLS